MKWGFELSGYSYYVLMWRSKKKTPKHSMDTIISVLALLTLTNLRSL